MKFSTIDIRDESMAQVGRLDSKTSAKSLVLLKVSCSTHGLKGEAIEETGTRVFSIQDVTVLSRSTRRQQKQRRNECGAQPQRE